MGVPSPIAQQRALLDVAGAPMKPPRWQGWQWTILGGTAAMGFSLLCNIIMLIVGMTHYDSDRGRGRLMVGSCDITPRVDTALHVLINILSALLLGASNAAMQCVSAPTRSDLDALHATGETADVGISGFRNLKFMGAFRRTVWVLLLVSSVPLHLFYNSVITSTITTFSWQGYLVSNNFTTGAEWNQTLVNEMLGMLPDKVADLQRLATAGSLKTLSRDDCLRSFNSQFAPTYASVLFVANQVPPSNVSSEVGSVLGYFTQNNPTTLYAQNLTLVAMGSDANNYLGFDSIGNLIFENRVAVMFGDWQNIWQPPPHVIDSWDDLNGNASVPDLSLVDHCLAEDAENLCTVDIIPSIQGLVIALNFVKMVCLLFILFKLQAQPLITIGDAIASYLKQPDEKTSYGGFIDMTLSKEQRQRNSLGSMWHISPKRHRWFRGVSNTRWIVTSIMCIGYLCVGIAGVALLSTFESNLGSISSGFSKGAIGTNNYPLNTGLPYTGTAIDTIREIVYANSFQLLLSIAYFQYNGVVTAMVLSREFTNFARDRKALRVSRPEGSQRRTFWLSLPYSYSMPLLILAGLLHWLLSEAIFYQEVAILPGTTILSELTPGDFGKVTHGAFISQEPLFVLVMVGATCILVVAGVGFRRYAGGIPIVRNNSLAISAACRPQSGRSADVTKPIQWGVRARDAQGIACDVGFSSDNVDVVDLSLVRLNKFEQAFHHFKSGFHGRLASWFRWAVKGKRPQHRSDSTDAILMHQGIHLYPKRDGSDTKISYVPLETAYTPGSEYPRRDDRGTSFSYTPLETAYNPRREQGFGYK